MFCNRYCESLRNESEVGNFRSHFVVVPWMLRNFRDTWERIIPSDIFWILNCLLKDSRYKQLCLVFWQIQMCVQDKMELHFFYERFQSKVVQALLVVHILLLREQWIQKIDVKCGDKRHKRHISSLFLFSGIKEMFQL